MSATASSCASAICTHVSGYSINHLAYVTCSLMPGLSICSMSCSRPNQAKSSTSEAALHHQEKYELLMTISPASSRSRGVAKWRFGQINMYNIAEGPGLGTYMDELPGNQKLNGSLYIDIIHSTIVNHQASIW